MKTLKNLTLIGTGIIIGFAAGLCFKHIREPKVGNLNVLPGEDGLDRPILALTLDDENSIFEILKSKRVTMDVEILDSQE